MKTDAEGMAGSELMNDLKQRLSELQELLEENYITESEYAAARANVLLDAGVDISVRPRAAEPRRRMYRLEARSRRAAAASGYERFLVPGLLIAGALVCAVFFFWMLSEGGLFSPRRKNLLPSTPPPSAPFVQSGAEPEDFGEDGDSGAEPGDSDAESGAFGGDEDGGGFFADFASPGAPEPSEAPRPAVSGDSVPPEAPVPKLNVPEKIPGLPAEETALEESGVRGWAVVSARRVRIRAAPDISADNVLGWAAKGERYAVLGEVSGKNGSKWYNVRYEKINKNGWISASMMELE
jgi:hypothetical protein